MEASSMQINSGQPCDICGNIGYAKDIVTCSKCHKTREHTYCMNPNLYNVPKSWHCEACRCYNTSHLKTWNSAVPTRYPEEKVQDSSKSQNKWGTVDVSSKVPDASRAICSPSGKPDACPSSKNFVPKKVETGKVKFLSVEDICGTSSGDKRKRSCLRGGSSSQIGSFGTNHHSTQRTSGDVAASLKCFSEKDHARKSARHPEPLTVGRVHTSTPQTLSVKLSQPLQGLKSPSYFPCKSSTSENLNSVAVLTSRDKRHISETHSSPLNHIGHVVSGVQERCEFENTSSRLDKHSGKVDSLLSKDYICKEIPVDSVVCCDEDGTSNSKVSFKFGEQEQDLPNPPAVNASWKGCFEILNFHHELYEGFQAYPPEKVSRKAYLVSKQMPRILQVTMQPRRDVWPETFHTDSPSGFNIALYFWADDICRSRKKYNHLVEWMEKEDLSMRCCLDGVELLIFTSKQLAVESRKMNMQFYLWGVFHSLKGQHSSIDLKGKQHAVNFPLHQRGQRGDFDAPPGFSSLVASNAVGEDPIDTSRMNLSPVAHEMDAPPGFSKSIEPSERDSSSKVTTQPTEKNGCGLPWSPIRASRAICYDSDTKVGEHMHNVEYQVGGDSMKAEGRQYEKLVHMEEKKTFPRTPAYDFHSCGISNEEDVNALDFRPTSGEKRHMERKRGFPRTPAYDFHSEGNSNKRSANALDVQSRSRKKRQMEQKKRFPRAPAYDFHSEGNSNKRSANALDVQSRSRKKRQMEQKKRFPRAPAYDFHSEGTSNKRDANALDVASTSGEKRRMEHMERFPRVYDFHSKGIGNKRYANGLDVQPRSREKRHMEHKKRLPRAYDFHSMGISNKRDANALDAPLTSGEKRHMEEKNRFPKTRECDFHSKGISNKRDANALDHVQPRSREKRHMEEKNRFPRTPADDFNSKGINNKRDANALDDRPRSREKRHMEENNRFPRIPADDFNSGTINNKRDANALDVPPTSGEKRVKLVHEQRATVNQQLCSGTKMINAEPGSPKNKLSRGCEPPERSFSRPHYLKDRQCG